MVFRFPIFVSSAYGKITDQILPKLHEKGHKIVIQPKFGYYGTPLKLDYAIMHGVTGSNSFENVGIIAKKYHIDIIVLMIEIWAVDVELLRKTVPKTLIISYFPNDTEWLSKKTIANLKKINYIIPMSEHCDKLLRKSEEIPDEKILDVIYPPIPPVFRKIEEIDHSHITGVPYDVLIGMVQMSKDILRKDQIRQMWAVKKAADLTGKKVGLYLHMQPAAAFDIIKAGEEIDFVDNLNVPLEEAYITGFTDEQMAQMYNSVDILLQCTTGEGFGMPTAEAILCGTPVVGVKNTATKELVMDTYPELAVDANETTVFRGIYDKIASFDHMIKKIVLAIESIDYYRDKYRGEKLRYKVDPDMVANQWDKALYEAFARLEKGCNLPPPRSPELFNRSKEIVEVQE